MGIYLAKEILVVGTNPTGSQPAGYDLLHWPKPRFISFHLFHFLKMRHSLDIYLRLQVWLFISTLMAYLWQSIWFLYFAMIWIVLGLMGGRIAYLCLKKVDRFLNGLGEIQGKIIFSLLYLLLITPLALIRRVFEREILDLSRKKGSYYKKKNHLFKKDDFRKLW